MCQAGKKRPRLPLLAGAVFRVARWLPSMTVEVSSVLGKELPSSLPAPLERGSLPCLPAPARCPPQHNPTMSDNPPANSAAVVTTPAPVDVAVAPVDVAVAKQNYQFLRLLAVIALVIGSISAFTLNLVDPDLWGHVAYGQDLLADGELPLTATHTFTAEGYRWINHENLAEITFAVGFDRLGVRGMLIAKCLLGMSVLTLMLLAAKRYEVRTLTAWAFLLLIANNLKAFFVMRPQLLSFACCAAMLLLLEYAFANWRRTPETPSEGTTPNTQCRVGWPWLVAIPLLLVVWVNSHGGFVAGYCILGALLAGRAVEALLVDRKQAVPTVAGMTAIGLASLLMLFANPYGSGLVAWLVESLGSPRPEITEWASLRMRDPVFWPFVTLAGVAAAALLFTSRRRDWTQVAILALVGWQAVEHVRHIAFFALLCGFWIPVHLQSALSRVRRRAAAGLPVTDIGPVLKWTAAGALGVAIVLPSFSIGDRLAKLPVPRRMYPVDAFDFLAAHEINGRMVVSFNWAQFALAAFPESTVSFDGRFRTCYPQEVVDMNFDFLLGEHRGMRHRSPSSGPIDGLKVLEYGDPELVVVDRNYSNAVDVMKQAIGAADRQWVLLYQDAVAQVWGRKRVFDDPNNSRYLPSSARLISDVPRPLAVQWPALPIRKNREVAAQESLASDGDS